MNLNVSTKFWRSGSPRRFKVSILQLSGWEPLPHLCTSHNAISLFHRMVLLLWCQNALIVYTIRQIELFMSKRFCTKRAPSAHTHLLVFSANAILDKRHWEQTFKMFLLIMYSSKFKLSQCIVYDRANIWNAKHSSDTHTHMAAFVSSVKRFGYRKHSSYVLWLYVNLCSFT